MVTLQAIFPKTKTYPNVVQNPKQKKLNKNIIEWYLNLTKKMQNMSKTWRRKKQSLEKAPSQVSWMIQKPHSTCYVR